MEDTWKRDVTCSVLGGMVAQPRQVEQGLLAAVRQAAEKGARIFLCGGGTPFDKAAVEAVLKLKQEVPQVQLVLVVGTPRTEARSQDPQALAAIEELVPLADEVYRTFGDHAFNEEWRLNAGDMSVFCYVEGSPAELAMRVRAGAAYIKVIPVVVEDLVEEPRGEAKKEETKMEEDYVFSRINLQHLREFLLHGTDLAEDEIKGKTLQQRARDTERALLDYFRSKYPDEKEYDEVTGKVLQSLSAWEDVYLEMGMQAGAKLIWELLASGGVDLPR